MTGRTKRVRFGWDEPRVEEGKSSVGIAISRDGKVYVADTASDKVLFMIKTAHILMILVIQENLLRQAGLRLTKKAQAICC